MSAHVKLIHLTDVGPEEVQAELDQLAADDMTVLHVNSILHQGRAMGTRREVAIYCHPAPRPQWALGRRFDALATTWFDVWTGPTERVIFPAAPVALEVVSESAANTDGGTGAHAVSLTLLDGAYDASEIAVRLNGTTPVPVPGGPFFRVNPSRVTEAGSYGWTEGGGILIRQAGGGDVYDHIPADANNSFRAVHTVPSGSPRTLTRWRVSLHARNQNSDVLAELQRREPVSGLSQQHGVWSVIDLTPSLGETYPQHDWQLSTRLVAGTDVRISAYAATSGDKVSGRFSVLAQ